MLLWRALAGALLGLGAVANTGLGLDAAGGRININLRREPPTLDPQKVQDSVCMTLVGHVMEGLTRLDPQGKVIPAVAESWTERSPIEYVFKLRKEAVWADQRPVRAADFVYAWERGVDPATASPYAFFLAPLAGAAEITQGKKVPLGAVAVDERTLVVKLARPTPYLLNLLAMPTFFPARRDVVQRAGEGYGNDSDKLLSNGPFILAEWKHNQSLRLTKNPTYWNRAQIALNEINMPHLILDANTEVNMFKQGLLDMVTRLTADQLGVAQKAKAVIKKYNTGGITFLDLNTRAGVLANKNVRKAFQAALNRGEYVRDVNGIPGTTPAYAIIPSYMPGVKKTFGEEFPLAYADGDVTAGRRYLAAGLAELGLKELPEITLLTSHLDSSRRDAEYFQRYFKATLGVRLKLEAQSYKTFYDRLDHHQFEMIYDSWSPDYFDAMTFADLMTSWNGYNHTGWSSPVMDGLIRSAQLATDRAERAALLAQANALVAEEAPIIPIYLEYYAYIEDPRLAGVIRRTVGPDPDFYYAKIRPTLSSR